MKTKKKNMIGIIVSATLFCIFFAATGAFADYMSVTYTDESGQSVPAIFTRCNNNGRAVGVAGDGMLEYLINFGQLGRMIEMTGLVCTDMNSPNASTAVYNPTQMKAHGNIIALTGEGTEVDCPWAPDSGVTLKDYTFLPLDINDNDTIVGAFVYKNSYDEVGVAGFIADYPWTLPVLVCNTDARGNVVPTPTLENSAVVYAFATGISNSGDIVGVVVGLMGTGGYASLTQGYIFNRRAVDDDGLLGPDEFTLFNNNGSVMTFPLSINNSGNISGYALSLKYPLAEGSYMTDIDGNYLLSDDGVRIPAGIGSCSDLLSNLLMPRYLKMVGFVVHKDNLDTEDIRTVDMVDRHAIEAEQQAGVVEIYGTIPYTILDSDRVLFAYSNVVADNGRSDALLTLNALLASLLDPTTPTVGPNTASLVFGQASPPNYDMTLAQGYSFPGSDLSGFGDINTYGTAVGGYTMDGALKPYIYTPETCIEDNSGQIDIMGAPACITTAETPLYIPVRVQAAPNDVHALGFEVIYDPNVLEYVDFVTDPTDNDLPSTLLAGWQASGNDSWGGNQAGVGVVRIGAFTNDSPIREGQEGILGYLVFHSFSAEQTWLDIQALTDDIATWNASGACLAKATGDCNDDGVVTPADALCAFQKALGVYETDCGAAIEIATDVDGDSDTDMYDVLCIFKYYLGLPSCLGTPETTPTQSVAF